MSWRFAAAKLASPGNESRLLIEFQSPAIIQGPGPLAPPAGVLTKRKSDK